MIQIKKESIIKTYREKDILIETIKQFYYSTEEEKLEHCKLMKEDGFTDSGQVKENIGTVMQPELVWFGSYYKYDVVNRNWTRISYGKEDWYYVGIKRTK